MKPITQADVDEMKANGYDPFIIAEERTCLEHLEAGKKIIEIIRQAFSGVTLGDGVSLRQALGLDDHESDEVLEQYRAQDEKENWERVSSEDVSAYNSSLSFFDPEGMRFYLPAYLIADLKGEYGYGMDFCLTHLSEHGRSYFQRLNKEQRLAVRAFLLHIRSDPDYRFSVRMIDWALECYWTVDGVAPEVVSD